MVEIMTVQPLLVLAVPSTKDCSNIWPLSTWDAGLDRFVPASPGFGA
jgi:hypothetical protein